MKTQLTYFGVTHKTAPVSVRERFGSGADRQVEMLRELAKHADECAILNTCGRLEIYAVTETPSPPLHLSHIARALAIPQEAIAAHFHTTTGDPCAKHLLRVAAGMESQIVGEPQILRQVRQAFETANHVGSTGPILSALFRAAIHTGRRVRRDPVFQNIHQSIAQLAAAHIESKCATPDPTVVIVGSGHIAGEMSRTLARGPARLVIANRNSEHARGLAQKVGAVATTLAHLPTAIKTADAVVTCSSAPSFIITRDTLTRRYGNDITLVDLAVPRNIDPAIITLPGVALIHLDNLAAPHRPVASAVTAVESMIDDQLQRFLRWQRARSAAPRIRAILRKTGSKRLQHPLAELVKQAAA